MSHIDANTAADAIDEIAARHNIDPDGLWQAVADAMLAAYRRLPGAYSDVDLVIDVENFGISVLSFENDPNGVDVTPGDFGRIAASVFKRAVDDHVATTVRQLATARLADKEGTVVTGTVQNVDTKGLLVNVDGLEGVLPADELLSGDSFRRGDAVTALLVHLRPSGEVPMLLSRTRNAFLRQLLTERIPDIAAGRVAIVNIARSPGRRSKVLVSGTDGLRSDPAGLVIGPRGTKIHNVTCELSSERVDIVSWRDDPAQLIAEAVATPGVSVSVEIVAEPGEQGHKGVANIYLDARDQGRVLGSGGVNIVLAERLTGYRLRLVAQ